MIEEICEHSIDVSMIQAGSCVLDVGCRGFGFSNALAALGAVVYPVDIDDLGSDQSYTRCAITATEGLCGIQMTDDPQARHTIAGTTIVAHTIASFSKFAGVTRWAVIKLDCEGDEFGILSALTAPPADQITVEFHQHTARRRAQAELDSLFDHLRQWYAMPVCKFDSRHGVGFNYWDCLFTIK